MDGGHTSRASDQNVYYYKNPCGITYIFLVTYVVKQSLLNKGLFRCNILKLSLIECHKD